MSKKEKAERFKLAEEISLKHEALEQRALNNLLSDLYRMTDGVLHYSNKDWKTGWVVFNQYQNLFNDGHYRRLYCTGRAFDFMVVMEGWEGIAYRMVDLGNFEFNDLTWVWESLLNEKAVITTKDPDDEELMVTIKQFKEDRNYAEASTPAAAE